MKYALFLTSLFILLLIPCAAQESILCPKINVSAPQSKIYPGEPMPFSISISEAESNLKLEYDWETSNGESGEGRGTSAITVNTAGLENTVVKLTVKIKGLPKNCKDTFQAEGIVEHRAPINDPDEIAGQQTYSEAKARIRSMYAEMSKDPEKIAIIINYGTNKEVAARTAQFIRAIKAFKYDRSRVKFIRGSSEPGIKNRIFIVTKKELEKLKP